ncbi:hypothetical protein DFJ73DRAFT_69400 [Zopfochytrium polystomum]|nr:hypothetical protein DFJ73DRAFT_69400 [Zopfochytrium polystomum]
MVLCKAVQSAPKENRKQPHTLHAHFRTQTHRKQWSTETPPTPLPRWSLSTTSSPTSPTPWRPRTCTACRSQSTQPSPVSSRRGPPRKPSRASSPTSSRRSESSTPTDCDNKTERRIDKRKRRYDIERERAVVPALPRPTTPANQERFCWVPLLERAPEYIKQ